MIGRPDATSARMKAGGPSNSQILGPLIKTGPNGELLPDNQQEFEDAKIHSDALAAMEKRKKNKDL